MARDLDEEKKKRMASETAAKKADLEKRATEFKHLPGTPDEIVALLKGIDSLPEAERASALKACKESLAVRAYLRTVIDDIDEALGTSQEGHVSHRRH